MLDAITGAVKGAIAAAGGKAGLRAEGTALFAYGVRVGNAGLLFLLNVLLARWLGEFEFGIYVLVWTWVILLGLVSALGLGTGVLRFIPEYRTHGTIDRLRGVLFTSRIIVLAAATLLAAAGAAVVALLGGAAENVYFTPFLVGLVCLPLLALTTVQDGIARSYDWTDLALLPPFLVRPVLLLVFMVVSMAAGFAPTATTALYCAIGATWLSAIAQYLLLQRRLKGEVSRGPRAYVIPVWLRVSMPLLLVDGFYLLMVNTDVLALSLFVPPDQVGVYFAAAKLLALVSMVQFAVSVASGHRFATFHSAGDQHGLVAFIRSMSRWTFWPSLAAATTVVVLGLPLLWLFGESFTAAYPILFVLAVGIVARASIGPADRLLSVIGDQDSVARIYFSLFAINVCLNLLLIPIFGIFGAATATALTLICESVLLNRQVRKRVGIDAFVLARHVPRPEARHA